MCLSRERGKRRDRKRHPPFASGCVLQCGTASNTASQHSSSASAPSAAASSAATASAAANSPLTITTPDEIQCAWWVTTPGDDSIAAQNGGLAPDQALSVIQGTNGNPPDGCRGDSVLGNTVVEDTGDAGQPPSVLTPDLKLVCSAPIANAPGDEYAVYANSDSIAAAKSACSQV